VVAIIGSGPAGLAAAAQLACDGITQILIIERDDAPGGLPRFCNHLGFGWEYSHRLDTGPRFVRRLLQDLPPTARILLRTTALSVSPGPLVNIVGPETGVASIKANAVLVATGIRERSRGSRLVPGTRPEHGILTTGLLQQLVARGVSIAPGRMVVVGSEHVAFSAILTGWRAGLRTVAMVELQARPQSWPIAALIGRAMGTEMLVGTQILEVLGRNRVESVVVREIGGQVRTIACEYVLFSGSWVPETSLIVDSGGEVDEKSGGPIVDQYLRTTIPAVFAAGNVLRPVESSGRAALEGVLAARCVAALLGRHITQYIGTIPIEAESPLCYVVPQRWAVTTPYTQPTSCLSLRTGWDFSGQIVLISDGAIKHRSKPIRRRANRQIRIRVDDLLQASHLGSVQIRIDPLESERHSDQTLPS
jgi:thioredoxin reductase